MNGQEGVAREEARGGEGESAKLPPLPRRRRMKLIALGAGLFVCGLFVGSGATVGIIRHRALSVLRNPEELAPEVLEHWCDELDLTEEQEEQALGILEKKHLAFMRAIRDGFDETRAEIRAVLTEEQAGRWDRDMSERREFIFGQGAGE